MYVLYVMRPSVPDLKCLSELQEPAVMFSEEYQVSIRK